MQMRQVRYTLRSLYRPLQQAVFGGLTTASWSHKERFTKKCKKRGDASGKEARCVRTIRSEFSGVRFAAQKNIVVPFALQQSFSHGTAIARKSVV
jgi:hypothetical protein